MRVSLTRSQVLELLSRALDEGALGPNSRVFQDASDQPRNGGLAGTLQSKSIEFESQKPD